MESLAKLDTVWIVLTIALLSVLRLAVGRAKNNPLAENITETCDTVRWVLALSFLLIRPFVAQAFYIPSESMVQTLEINDRLVTEKLSYRFSEPKRTDVVVFAAPARATVEQQEGTDFIKRLIGLPGETVEVRGAKLILGPTVYGPINADPRDDTAHDTVRERLHLSPKTRVKFLTDGVLVGDEHLSCAQLAARIGFSASEVKVVPGVVLINGKALDEPYTREDPGYDMLPQKIAHDQYFFLGDNRNNSHDSHAWGTVERWRLVGHGIFTYWPLSRIGRIP